MTRLTGEFHTDLSQERALEACAEAVHGLGWEMEPVQPGRVVAYPKGSGSAPVIEFELAGSGEGTDVRIAGSDTEEQQLEKDDLVAELDCARDAMTSAFEAAPAGDEPSKTSSESSGDETSKTSSESESPKAEASADEPSGDGGQKGDQQATPAGWYPDAYDSSRLQYWDGEKWTQDYRPVGAGKEASVQPHHTPAQKETPAPSETPARFRSLHVIANIYGVLGWVVAIVGSLVIIGLAVAAAGDEGGGEAVYVFVAGVLGVGFYVLMLFGISAAIRLALAVEENTRATTELLKGRRGR